MKSQKGLKRYHHGDARAALVHAAGEVLEESGAASMSLRAVAERAGISRQAPYNHFPDKESLLATLVVLGFEQLTDAVRSATSGLVGEDALAACAEAYIGIAQHNPNIFRLMFARELVDIAKFENAVCASKKAFAVLQEVVATTCPPSQVADLSLAAWCLVHGYATLCNETGIESPEQRRTRAQMFAHIIAVSITPQ